MKQSGIDWIGEIPDDWKIIRLKHIFQIKKDIAGKEGFTVLSVTQTGIRPKDMSSKGQFALDYSKYQLVNSGEFIMNHMDLKTGWIDISKYNGVTSPDYRVFYLTDKNCVKDYYKQIFQYCYKNLIFFSLGQGVADLGRWRLPAEMFNNFKLPLPPKATQQRIAEYLDSKCAQIDSIIEESKKSIEEYKAWKQSVIFEAVTGKNLNCKKKDSGIEWIGEVPDVWTCTKLKYYIQIKSGDAIRNEELTDLGLYQVFGGGECIGMTNLHNADSSNILIGRVGARCGCITKPNDKVWATDNALIVSSNMNRDFLTYCLQAVNLNELNNSNAQPLITGTKVKNTFIPIPDNPEQKKIVTYLDSKCAQIDSLIAEKESLITDLTEYKKSLIFEVVTGKRGCRHNLPLYREDFSK